MQPLQRSGSSQFIPKERRLCIWIFTLELCSSPLRLSGEKKRKTDVGMVAITDVWLGAESTSSGGRPCGRKMVRHDRPAVGPIPTPPKTARQPATERVALNALIASPRRSYLSRHHHSILDHDSKTVNVCWAALCPKMKYVHGDAQSGEIRFSEFAHASLMDHVEPCTGRRFPPRVTADFIGSSIGKVVPQPPSTVVTPRKCAEFCRGIQGADLLTTLSTPELYVPRLPSVDSKRPTVSPPPSPRVVQLCETLRTTASNPEAVQPPSHYSRQARVLNPRKTASARRTRSLTARLPRFDKVVSAYSRQHLDDTELREKDAQQLFETEMLSTDAVRVGIYTFQKRHC